MSDNGLKFVLDLEQKLTGIEKAIGAIDTATSKIERMTAVVDKLEMAQQKIKAPKALKETEKQVTANNNAFTDLEKKLGLTSKATLTMEQQFKSARDELKRLKAPAELKKIRDEIEAIHAGKIGGAMVPHGMGEGMFSGVGKIASGMFLAEGAMGAIRAMTSVIESAVTGMVNLGKQALLTAGHQEKVALSFKQLLGKDAASEMLGYIDRLSTKTAVSGDKLQEMARQFLDAGAAASEVRPLLAGALDVASILGGSEAAVERATGALSKLRLSGKATEETFEGLKLTEEAAFASIMKASGKNLQDVKGLMGEGKIGRVDMTNSVLDALRRKTSGGALGEFADQAGQTLEARLLHLENIPTRLFERLADGPAFAKISGFIDKLANFFDPSSPMGAKMMEALTRTFDIMAAKLEKVDLNKLGEQLIGFLDKLPERIDRVAVAIERLGGLGVKLAAPALTGKDEGGLFSYMSGLAKSGGLFGTAEGMKRVEALGDFSGKGKIAKSTWTGFGDGADAEAMWAGRKLAAQVERGFREKAEIHSPSKVFERLGRHTVEGFNLGVRGMHDDMNDAFRPMVDIASPSSGAPSAPSGMMGSITISAPIHIDGSKSPQETAEAVARILPAQLAIALDRLSGEFAFA